MNPARLRRATRWLAGLGLPALLAAILVVGSLGLPPSVHAADRTWSNAGGDGLWTNPANWVGGVPGTTDRAIFDPGTSVAGVTINANVSVGGILVMAGYPGTIAQSAGMTLTVGAQAFTQSGGTFSGGNAALTINGAFTVNAGGLFTSTSGTLTVTGVVTLGTGVFSHNNGSVVFSVSNVALNLGGAATFNNVQFLSGTKTIAAGNTLTVLGTLELTGGAVDTGILAAQGNVNARVGFTGGGTATLLINGSGDQVFDGDHSPAVGALPNVEVNKPSGSLTLTDTLRTNRNWTITAVPGGLTVTGSTLVFNGNLTITGSHTLNNVEIRSGTVVIAAGTTVTVPGITELFGGTLNQAAATGILAAQGNVNARVGFTGGGTATLLINGSGDQVFDGDHSPAVGALPNVEVNKPSGSLTLTDTLRTNRNWTITAVPGGLTVTGSTLVFNGNLTITGSHTLNNVEIRSGTVVIAAGTTVTVPGITELFGGTLNQAAATGILAAQGNVNARVGFTGGGTATLLINGSGDQVFDGDHSPAVGALPNVEVNKPSGSLTLTDTLRTNRNWTITAVPGGLTVTGSTLVFNGNLTITGSHTLNNVEIRSGTVVIAAGTTVTVPGITELFGGTLNQAAATGILAAQGNVNARVGFTGGGTATLLINGSGDQVFDGDHSPAVGALPNVEVNKPSGSLTLTDTLRTNRNWTITAVPGGLTVTGSTLVFNGNLTITGSHTLNNVEIRSGTVVIAAGTTVTVPGTTTLTDGDLNGGTLEALGDLIQGPSFDGETATIRIAGTTDQTFSGSATPSTDLPHLVIDKPAGTLFLVGTIRTTSVGWTWVAGAVDPGVSTIVFNGSTITGSHALHHVEINGGTVTIAAGTTLTVAGTTTLFDGDLNGDTLAAHGDISQAATFDGETGTIRIVGSADQTFTGAATANTDLPNLVIDKPAGTLFLVGTIRTTAVGWSWVAGDVDEGTSTLVFNGSTITGSHALHDVELQGGTTTIAVGDTLTVGGTTTLTDGDLNGGTLGALGDITILGTFDGETGTLLVAGTADQTMTGSATLTSGDMANVVIDKPGGTLSLVGTIRLITASWTWLTGAVDPGTSLLVLDSSTAIAGTHTLNEVYVRGSGHTIGAGMPTAGGTLTLDNGTIDGGTLGAAGNLDQLSTFDGGSGTIVITGSADQTFAGSATLGVGDLPNIDIDKSAGTLTLSGILRLNGASWIHTDGTVDPAASLVVFSGTSTIGSDGMSFHDLTVNGGTTTLVENLLVDDALEVLAGTLDGGGHTAAVGGNVTVDGGIAVDTLQLVMNGVAPQTLGGASAAIGLLDLTVSNATGVTQTTGVTVSDVLTLSGPLDFSGEWLGIANPIAGTPANLAADSASSLEVFGSGSGIIIPAGLSALANLDLDNPNGAALAGPISIGQDLTLADGILEARPWIVTIGPAGSVSRTAGHVNGSLEKSIPLGVSVTVAFEIGDSTTYAPVSVTFGMVVWGSTLTAQTTAGEHPNVAASFVRPTADVNRWWSLANGGILFDSADVTLSWAASDLDPGADPSSFVVAKWDASWTMPVAAMPTATSITAVDLTSFSAFAVGELEDGDLPDTAGLQPESLGGELGLRAAVVTTVLLALVAIVFGLTRRREPVRSVDRG